MSHELPTTRIRVKRRGVTLQTIARAALELTGDCYVWLERENDDYVVELTAKKPDTVDIAARFNLELERIIDLDKLERKTRLIRSAILGRALGPAPKITSAQQPGPALDPETEAEIEKLLAEIESDDWLEDASEIAKTWEERFGVDSKPECKEES